MELNCVLKIAGCAEELIKLLHLNNQSCDDHFAKISVAKAVDAMKKRRKKEKLGTRTKRTPD